MSERLAVLGAALFVHLTSELYTIGATSEIAAGLSTSPSSVGLLLTMYAVVAGIATLPATFLARRVGIRRALVWAMLALTVSLIGLAFSPTIEVAAASRVIGALGHGLVWSQVPVIASRLARPEERGRAVSTALMGASIALLLGAPLSSVLAQQVGWRAGAGVLAIAAAGVAWALGQTIPDHGEPERFEAEDAESCRVERQQILASHPGDAVVRWWPVAGVCLVTVVVVIGHYISYGYLDPLASDLGLGGAWLAPTLSLYGLAGLAAVAATGRILDRWPALSAGLIAGGFLLGLGGLVVAHDRWTALAALVCWGAAAGGLPTVLNAVVIRVAGAEADTASGAYVVAYQMGIAGGSALGAAALSGGSVTDLPSVSLAVIVGAVFIASGVSIARRSPRLTRSADPRGANPPYR